MIDSLRIKNNCFVSKSRTFNLLVLIKNLFYLIFIFFSYYFRYKMFLFVTGLPRRLAPVRVLWGHRFDRFLLLLTFSFSFVTIPLVGRKPPTSRYPFLS